jgi:hypothetical protein
MSLLRVVLRDVIAPDFWKQSLFSCGSLALLGRKDEMKRSVQVAGPQIRGGLLELLGVLLLRCWCLAQAVLSIFILIR